MLTSSVQRLLLIACGGFPLTLKLCKFMKEKRQFPKKNKINCKKLLHSHKVVFWVIGTRYISQNTLLTFNGHMIHLSVGSGSLGLDVAGATGSPSASHNSSKDEWMI